MSYFSERGEQVRSEKSKGKRRKKERGREKWLSLWSVNFIVLMHLSTNDQKGEKRYTMRVKGETMDSKLKGLKNFADFFSQSFSLGKEPNRKPSREFSNTNTNTFYRIRGSDLFEAIFFDSISIRLTLCTVTSSFSTHFLLGIGKPLQRILQLNGPPKLSFFYTGWFKCDWI